MEITDEKVLFDEEFLKEIQDRFFYVHEDYLGRERQFFENSGGSLRLKAAVEEKARLEKIPDCPERIHDISLMLKQVKAKGMSDIMQVIFGAKSGALVTELTASQVMFQIVSTIMLNEKWGKNAVVTSIEHPSAYDSVELYCGLTGREFRVAMANPKTGGVDIDEILSKVDKDTLLLSVMSASNISGYIFDIEKIAKEARKINPDIYIVSDAVQHAPHGVLDVEACGLDGANFAPYKMFGIRGCGYGYVSDRVAKMTHHKLLAKPEKEWELGTFPQMDFVIQSQNRLWGCKYQEASGLIDGINEIYACKLGDATNWNVYQGISTDSYTASCGTLGRFTGAANVNGYPIFFKENCYHKVYVSSTGAHQIQDKAINGVQDGCSGSVAMVGDICYYKSRAGIVAFDGSTTYSTGDNLGDIRYTEAVGGSANDKYYISMKDSSGQWTIFAYDTSKSLWHKEDSSHALMFCSMSGDTFFVTEESNNACNINLISDYNKTDTQETAPEWEAVTGLQGYSYTGQKYISRFNLRMVLPKGSYMDIYIEYDSSGKWEHQGHIKGVGTTSFMIPVRPRRCDHFRIKLAGAGDVRLYSMSKLFEGGTDVR